MKEDEKLGVPNGGAVGCWQAPTDATAEGGATSPPATCPGCGSDKKPSVVWVAKKGAPTKRGWSNRVRQLKCADCLQAFEAEEKKPANVCQSCGTATRSHVVWSRRTRSKYKDGAIVVPIMRERVCPECEFRWMTEENVL